MFSSTLMWSLVLSHSIAHFFCIFILLPHQKKCAHLVKIALAHLAHLDSLHSLVYTHLRTSLVYILIHFHLIYTAPMVLST